MIVCRKCRVTGHVQGVFFRETTRREALRLGVTGHAINRPDGSVEVIACGQQAVAEQLCAWLWQGSAASAVENVECQVVEMEAPAVFTTGRSH